jgi:signal transduction histidine kinase
MEIRSKLTIQFSGTVGLILFSSFLAIYLSFSESRKVEFYQRLSDKSRLVAQMLLEIEEINADVLGKIEQNNPLNLANEKIVIYDYDNTVLFSSDTTNALRIGKGLIHEARAKREIRFAAKSYEVCGLLYPGNGTPIVVFTAAIDLQGMKKLKMLRNILLFVFIVSLLFIIAAGRLFANRALKPIERIVSQVDEIGITNLDARVDEGNGKDEMAKLAITFNNMLRRLEASFRIQRTFIANASHELRNPLTAISGQLEVLLMTERPKEEYLYALRSVHEDAIQINQLANNLLLLAQTNPESTSHSFTRVRIDDTLWQATNDIRRRYADFQIGINFSETIEDESSLIVQGNELLIKTAFLNLLENAYKYSPDHQVTLLVSLKSGHVVVEFTDHGIGIAPEEVQMIFNPFYRSKNAFDQKGHGIGLTLVENIAVLHHGYVTVQSEIGKGSTFGFYLPLESE